MSLKKALEPVKGELILICSDKDLCKAAEKEGIKFIDPEEDTLGKLSNSLAKI